MLEIYSLNKQKLYKTGRASNMLWMQFGSVYERTNKLNKTVRTSEYALHVQCPWRIVDGHSLQICVASNDFYDLSEIAMDAHSADWEKPEYSLFDEKISELFTKDAEVRVKKVKLSRNRDLIITFTNDFRLECFVNTSTEIECWRFLSRDTAKHLVSYGANIRME